MMNRKASFARAFLQAGLPTWIVMAVLMIINRSQIDLIGFLVMLFPGLWGALRLQVPGGSWLRRAGYYLAFCLTQGVGVTILLFATAIALASLGLASGKGNTGTELLIYALVSVLLPVFPFLTVRSAIALPSMLRRLNWRVVIIRAGITIAIIVVIVGGGYWWMSQPYTSHASFSEPRIATASLLTDLNSADGWQVPDSSIKMQSENSELRFTYSITPTWFYSITGQIKPGELSRADGFRLRARSDAPMSFLVELAEMGGGKYRSWVDLPMGDWKTILVTDFLPYLQARDANGNLDWERVERIALYTYAEAPGTSLELDKIELVVLDHSGDALWQVTTTDHFWIRYHPSDESVVADVRRVAEDQFERLTTVIGYRPVGVIPITIVSDHAELEQRQGAIKPSWAQANAFPDSLDILTPRLYSPVFNGHRYEDVFELVPHELAHLLTGQVVGYPGFREMPMWLNEGLATFLANQKIDEHGLANGAQQGTLPSFQELEKPFREQSQPGICYSMAKSITGYLVENYGAEKIRPLMESLGHGMDFDAALRQVIGIDRDTLELEWRQSLIAIKD